MTKKSKKGSNASEGRTESAVTEEEKKSESSSVPTPGAACPANTNDDVPFLLRKHNLDSRRFFVTLIATMAASFYIGSTRGPVDTFDAIVGPLIFGKGHVRLNARQKQQTQVVPDETSEDGWTILRHAPPVPPEPASDAEAVDGMNHRRKPTDRLAELGDLIDRAEGEEDKRDAGQHLLMDMRNIASAFLGNEEKLVRAMMDVVEESGLSPLLSYNCNQLDPAGHTCIGVLLETYFSFHTWPEEGVITLDMFSNGPLPLITVIPIIKRFFGILRDIENEGPGIILEDTEYDPTKVVLNWAHQLRGFRTRAERTSNYLDDESDLALWVTTNIDHQKKDEVFSYQTKMQRVDIWDILGSDATPNYFDMKSGPYPLGDPHYKNSEFANPERLLFLNGIIQSANDTQQVYAETLVHPAMFAHRNPKRVAIIGGGDGATLREVLKHKTVEQVVVLEKDEEFVQIAREHLKQNNDCSNQVGAVPVCFDDPRADIRYVDAIPYFKNSFDLDQGQIAEDEKFDVVIIDAEDPTVANTLNEEQFLDAIVGSLTEEGIVAVEVGAAPSIYDPPEDRSLNKIRDAFFKHLEKRIDSLFVYEESRCGFYEPHAFVVGCMNKICRNYWYSKSDAIDYEIYERIHPSVDKEPALFHFDGSTQHGYKYIPRAWEDLYCRREPEPEECKYRQLDLKKEVIDWNDNFEVKKDEDGNVGIYTTTEIQEGSYIMAEELAASLFISSETHKNLVDSTQSMPESNTVVIDNFIEFTEKYGRESLTEGPGSKVIEIGPSILGRRLKEREKTNAARIASFLPPLPTYSPVFERNRRMFDVLVVATRNIAKGEELLIFDD
mmetsp:Transcript_9388/g.20809  ORF Transcript_9388/g.20809 Transcript_9388/m.20809 type:complete len:836 (-) Transcript_9388:139-2646(-)